MQLNEQQMHKPMWQPRFLYIYIYDQQEEAREITESPATSEVNFSNKVQGNSWDPDIVTSLTKQSSFKISCMFSSYSKSK